MHFTNVKCRWILPRTPCLALDNVREEEGTNSIHLHPLAAVTRPVAAIYDRYKRHQKILQRRRAEGDSRRRLASSVGEAVSAAGSVLGLATHESHGYGRGIALHAGLSGVLNSLMSLYRGLPEKLRNEEEEGKEEAREGIHTGFSAVRTHERPRRQRARLRNVLRQRGEQRRLLPVPEEHQRKRRAGRGGVAERAEESVEIRAGRRVPDVRTSPQWDTMRRVA